MEVSNFSGVPRYHHPYFNRISRSHYKPSSDKGVPPWKTPMYGMVQYGCNLFTWTVQPVEASTVPGMWLGPSTTVPKLIATRIFFFHRLRCVFECLCTILHLHFLENSGTCISSKLKNRLHLRKSLDLKISEAWLHPFASICTTKSPPLVQGPAWFGYT